MSRLTRFLDAEHERGRQHGATGMRPRVPGRSEYASRYGRMAYDAGFAQGRSEFAALANAITVVHHPRCRCHHSMFAHEPDNRCRVCEAIDGTVCSYEPDEDHDVAADIRHTIREARG